MNHKLQKKMLKYLTTVNNVGYVSILFGRYVSACDFLFTQLAAFGTTGVS